MKINGKLLTAFGAVLFLSSILAVWGYYSINRIMEIRTVEKTFKDISANTLKMRKSEKDFLMRDTKSEEFMSTGKSKYISDIDNIVQNQDSLINAMLESKWSSKLDLQDELAELNKSTVVYHETFNKIAKAYLQRGFKDYGDEGELRKAIRAVEESEYKIDMISLLTLRRIEKDFFLRKDLKDVENFQNEIKELKSKIDNSARGIAIKEKLSTYESNFNDVVKAEEVIGLTETGGLMGEMRSNIQKIEPIISTMEAALEERSQELALQTIITFAIVFLVELIIGIVLAIQFSNRLTENIRVVREAAVKLSEGIIPDQLTITTQDELGETQQSVNDLIHSLNDSVEVANLVSRGNLFSAQAAAKTKLKDGELDNALKKHDQEAE
jgi:HAMP domain-containing protein